MLVYFIGPGGAGKTTAAKLLSMESGFDYYDLDEYFMQRQMNRAYLNPVRAKEELKIRQRFQLYSNLKCRVLLTDQIPDQVAANVKQILDTLNKVKQGSNKS